MNSSSLNQNFMSKIRPFHWPDLVRLGRNHDGGYVVPAEIVSKTKVLLSLGYGNDFSFEKDYLNLCTKSRVILIDENASLFFFIRDLVQNCLKRLAFNGGHPRAALKNLLKFLTLKCTINITNQRKKVVSNCTTKNQVTLSFLLDELDTFETVLKMDIEGSEYECLLEARKLSNLSCLIIEFHDLPNKLNVFDEVLNKLDINFILVNCHINNFGKIINGIPETIELSFSNRRFNSSNLQLVNAIPSVFDQRNSVRFPEVHYKF